MEVQTGWKYLPLLSKYSGYIQFQNTENKNKFIITILLSSKKGTQIEKKLKCYAYNICRLLHNP